jgi:outer membrane immunogenic protein
VTTPSGDNRDGIYGAAIGYNYQMGSWLVVGVEGDWSKLEGEVRPIPACGGPCSTGAEWLATVRARAGVLLAPNYLLYATGGFAWADVHNSVTVASVDDSTTGWVYGVGLELRIDRSWSLKAEYLRVELDDTLACRVGPCGAANFATNHSLDIIRGGLNFKF